MEYQRFGRSLVPDGGLFDDYESAMEFVQALESDVFMDQVQNLSFTTDEEGLLNVLVNNKRYYITNLALKELCKLLKVPASYINKFPGRDLVLENLNNNPYLKNNDELIKLIVWSNGEEHPVIAGVLSGDDPAMTMTEYLELMHSNGTFEREEIKLDQIAVTDDELVVYFYLPKEIKRNGYSFHGGFALHYSSNRANDTVVFPFCKMSVVASTGEPFDFDFEGKRKLHVAKRKKEDFLSKTIELGQTYIGEDLGAYYEEAMKYGTVTQNMDTIKYSVLKYFKSRAVSSYNYSGIKVDGNVVTKEIIPEYSHFYSANKDDLMTMETYTANNLPVSFYIPAFFNRIFTFQSSVESPYFMLRYRKSIGNMLHKLLDEVGDIIVDMHEEDEG